MQITKKTIKVGNSAGVLLPKAYLNTNVVITLQPINIQKEILKILLKKNLLKQVQGIYLVGSQARKEQTPDSDIDILAITTSLNKKITEENYEIILLSIPELERQLQKNALPILPMLKEAVPILNENLIQKYKQTPLTKKNISWHIKTTKSAIKVIEKDLALSKELKEKNTNDRIIYSLILRLRTLYIIKQITLNKIPTKNGLLNLIRKIAGSTKSYERYSSSKNYNSSKRIIPIEETEKILNYLKSQIKNE